METTSREIVNGGGWKNAGYSAIPPSTIQSFGTMTINQKIALLREAMEAEKVQAYLIPSSDPHQSEYTADHWKGREWISGFTGSAGLVIVTPEHAGLWTDSRYYLQAETQLRGCEIQLHKRQVSGASEFLKWLKEQLGAGAAVGLNGALFSAAQVEQMEKFFRESGIELRTDLDLLDRIWTENRPPLPENEVFELALNYAGKSRKEKLRLIRQEMKERGADYHLVTALDDIAWTLNLRGQDVDYNPVAISYLLIGKRDAFLFIEAVKVPSALKEKLQKDRVKLQPYDAISKFLLDLEEDTVLLDPRTTNARLYHLIAEELRLRGSSAPRKLKAVKNETEIKNLRQAMRKDGMALLKLFKWLEAILDSRPVTEYDLSRQLDQFRRAQGDYYGESFGAIVGYEANGAIVHYRPDTKKSAQLQSEGILLLDSGGQYRNGTTDITRTIALGAPTEAQKHHYTLVLKGHIGLATAQFPAGTTGAQLDTLARVHLWREGLNYGHGTGHGVGFFLNVHEGPQSFSPRAAKVKLEPGMLLSNEPGYYQVGGYGIRIENLVLITEGPKTDHGSFYRLETLSLFPIDLNLVEPGLLTQREKDWLNAYHERVFEELSPLAAPEEVEWLQLKCRPVS